MSPEDRARLVVRQAIEKKGLALRTLDRLAGVSGSVVSRWLNGKRGITLGSYLKLCAALDLDSLPHDHDPSFKAGYAAAMADLIGKVREMDTHACRRLGGDWKGWHV